MPKVKGKGDRRLYLQQNDDGGGGGDDDDPINVRLADQNQALRSEDRKLTRQHYLRSLRAAYPKLKLAVQSDSSLSRLISNRASGSLKIRWLSGRMTNLSASLSGHPKRFA